MIKQLLTDKRFRRFLIGMALFTILIVLSMFSFSKFKEQIASPDQINLSVQTSAETCNIIYDLDGGSGDKPEDQSWIIGQEYQIPNKTNLEKGFKKFSVWEANIEGQTKIFSPGDKFIPNQDITLKAVYNIKPQAVLYDNGSFIFYFTDKSFSEGNDGVKHVIDLSTDDHRGTGNYVDNTQFIDTPWYQYRDDIVNVSFDESFNDYHKITKTAYWFGRDEEESIYHYKKLESFNGKNLDVSGIKEDPILLQDDAIDCRYGTGAMFKHSSVKHVDISFWDTSNLKACPSMFDGCAQLEDISFYKDPEHPDEGVINLDNVVNSRSMFRFCIKLKNIYGLEMLSLKSTKNCSYMFYNCISLDYLDFTSFDTSALNTSTDLGDTYGVSNMFSSCKNLKSIIVGNSWNISNILSSDNMLDCNSDYLKGGNGTKWISSLPKDKRYAKIDKCTAIQEMPGYLTYGGYDSTNISYDANFPEGAVNPKYSDASYVQCVESGDYFTVQGASNNSFSGPICDTHTFKGWSRNPKATSVDYEKGDFCQAVGHSMTLYAVWEPNTHRELILNNNKVKVSVGSISSLGCNIFNLEASTNKSDDADIYSFDIGESDIVTMDTSNNVAKFTSIAVGSTDLTVTLKNTDGKFDEVSAVIPVEVVDYQPYWYCTTEEKTDIYFAFDEHKNDYPISGYFTHNHNYKVENEDNHSYRPDFNFEVYNTVQKAVFKNSFKDYQPAKMSDWFYLCEKLISLDFYDNESGDPNTNGNIDTYKITDMRYMFDHMSSYSGEDGDGILRLPPCFDTSKVVNMSHMFDTLTNVKIIELPENFDNSHLTDVGVGNDRCCYAMFGECINLEKIFVGSKWVNTFIGTYHTNMFNHCWKLTGGNGFRFSDDGKTVKAADKTYAIVDKYGVNGFLSYGGQNINDCITVKYDANFPEDSIGSKYCDASYDQYAKEGDQVTCQGNITNRFMPPLSQNYSFWGWSVNKYCAPWDCEYEQNNPVVVKEAQKGFKTMYLYAIWRAKEVRDLNINDKNIKLSTVENYNTYDLTAFTNIPLKGDKYQWKIISGNAACINASEDKCSITALNPGNITINISLKDKNSHYVDLDTNINVEVVDYVPYAVYDDASKSLTFAFDNQKPSGDRYTIFDIPFDANPDFIPSWISSNDVNDIGNLTNVQQETKKVIFKNSFAAYKVLTCKMWFMHFNSLEEIDFWDNESGNANNNGNLDTRRCVDSQYMFAFSGKIKSLGLPNSFVTNNTKFLNNMFYEMSSIENISLSDGFMLDTTENINDCFSNDSMLKTIIVADDTNWNYFKFKDQILFNNDVSLIGGEGTTFLAYNIQFQCAKVDQKAQNGHLGYFTSRSQSQISNI